MRYEPLGRIDIDFILDHFRQVLNANPNAVVNKVVYYFLTCKVYGRRHFKNFFSQTDIVNHKNYTLQSTEVKLTTRWGWYKADSMDLHAVFRSKADINRNLTIIVEAV